MNLAQSLLNQVEEKTFTRVDLQFQHRTNMQR